MKHRLISWFLILAVSISLYPVPAQAQGGVNETPHKINSLVIANKTIYLIGKGVRRGFSSMNEFLTYRYRSSRIVAANEADLALPEGPVMRAKPGSLVLDLGDRRTIYLIGKNGEKQGFVSAGALKKYRKKKTVIWPIDLSGYPLGRNIE